MCGAYARIEAEAGNIDLARKICDMALCSVIDLSLDCQLKAPILYLSYAEAKLANHSSIGSDIGVSSRESKQRAIYILSCLGSGRKYSAYFSEHQVSMVNVKNEVWNLVKLNPMVDVLYQGKLRGDKIEPKLWTEQHET